MAFEAEINNFAAGWCEIVKRWGDLNDRYYEKYHDLPAWYVENSNSALFAAAAWNEGHCALCEVDAEKRFYSGRRGRPIVYQGRIDVELTLGDDLYWIEAKRRAFSLSAESNYSFRHSFIDVSVREAYHNAKQCRRAAGNIGAKMASMVFFSGHIEPGVPERVKSSTPLQRSEMVAQEIRALQVRLCKLSSELEGNLYHAIFSRRDFKIYKDWYGFHFPVAFGVVAVIDE